MEQLWNKASMEQLCNEDSMRSFGIRLAWSSFGDQDISLEQL